MAILVNYIDNKREGGGGLVGGGGAAVPLKHNCCLNREWLIASLSAGLNMKLH